MLEFLRRIATSLYWMIVAGLLLRLLVAFSNAEYILPIPMDEGGRIAEALVLGEGFSNPLAVATSDDFTLAFRFPTGPTAWRPPVFPLIEAGVFRIFGIYTIESAVALQILNCLFSALTCLPVYSLARHCFGDRVAIAAGWAWAFFPYAAIHATRFVFDAAFTTLVFALWFLAGVKLAGSHRQAAWAGFGLLSAFTVLTHSGAAVVIPPVGFWLLAETGWRDARTLRLALIAVLAFAAGMSPWWVRNYRVFGKFIPLRSNFGLELWVGNVANELEPRAYMLHPTRNLQEAHRMLRLGELAYMEAKGKEARELIRANPASFALRTIRRVVAFWTSLWDPRYSRLLYRHLKRTDVIFCTGVTLLGFSGLWNLWRERRALAWPFLFVFLTFPLAYYVTHYEFRYRHPIDPFLVALGTYAILRLARKTKHPATAPAV